MLTPVPGGRTLRWATRVAAKPGSLAAAVLLLPLSFQATGVNVAAKPGVDFAEYETYQWIEGVPARNELVHQRIVSGVENELAIKGLWRVESEPDLLLSYYVAVRSEVVIDSPYRSDWYDEGAIHVRRIHEGTLVLDVIDPSENELLWRGSITRALSDNPRRNDATVHDAVRDLLDAFPR